MAETLISEAENPKGLIVLPHGGSDPAPAKLPDKGGPLPASGFRRPDSAYLQVLRYLLYDRVTLDEEQASHSDPVRSLPAVVNLFTRPVGTQDLISRRCRSQADTNLLQCGRLPLPQSMHIDRIFFGFSPRMDPDDAHRILEAYVCELMVADRIMYRAPLLLYPNRIELDPSVGAELVGGRWLNISTEVDDGSGSRVPVVGAVVGPDNPRRLAGFGVGVYSTYLDIPIELEPGIGFEMRLIANRPVPVFGAVNFCSFLDGILSRPLQ